MLHFLKGCDLTISFPFNTLSATIACGRIVSQQGAYGSGKGTAQGYQEVEKAARGRCEGRWVMTLEPHPTRVTCRYGVLRVLGVVLVAAGLLSYFFSAFRKCHSIYIGSYYPSYPTYSLLNHPGDRGIRELCSYISQHAAKRDRSYSRCLYRTNRPRLQCPSISKV